MKALRWKGLWLLDILQKYDYFGEFTHADLQGKFGRIEQEVNLNKTKKERVTFRMGLIAAVKYGFIEQVRQTTEGGGAPIWIYQVPLVFRIMKDTPMEKLLNP